MGRNGRLDFWSKGLPNELLSLVLKRDLGGEEQYYQALSDRFSSPISASVNTVRMLEVTRAVALSTIVLAKSLYIMLMCTNYGSQQHQSIEFIHQKLATLMLIREHGPNALLWQL